MLAFAQPNKWVTVHVKEFIDEGAYRKNILLTSKYMYVNKIKAPVLFIFPFIAQGHVNWYHSSRTISSPLFYIDTFFLINSSKRDNIWVAQNFWQWVNWVFFMVSKNLVLFHEITWCRACACDQWFFFHGKENES